MKHQKVFLFAAFVFAFSFAAAAQSNELIKRTTYKTDRLDFGVGGTVSIVGAPDGSIRVEGWNNREVEISAEIEIEAANEADLARLSTITGFVLQESLGRTSIISTGVHNRKAIRKIDKKFPKHLFGSNFRVNYVVKVPRYTDIEIDGGKGDLHVSGVEGTMRINYIETNASIDLVGGGIVANFGTGSVDISIPSRSWRGRFADVQMASGKMNLVLPNGLNADFYATILRTGSIENNYSGFKPRTRNGEFTQRSIAAKAGTGSVPLKFSVGDGTMTISEIGQPS
ncbi:hypothetical protein BH24ACI3_BH24ACI3_06040 [soil metagenome]